MPNTIYTYKSAGIRNETGITLHQMFHLQGSDTQITPKTQQVFGVKPVEKPAKNSNKLNLISVCHAGNN